MAAERREEIAKEFSESEWLADTVLESDERQHRARAAAVSKRLTDISEALVGDVSTSLEQEGGRVEQALAIAQRYGVTRFAAALRAERHRIDQLGPPEVPDFHSQNAPIDDEPRIVSAGSPTRPAPIAPRTASERHAVFASDLRQEVDLALEQLAALRSPLLARGWGSWLTVAVASGAGVVAGGALSGFDSVMFATVGGGVGLCMGVLARLGIVRFADARVAGLARTIGAANQRGALVCAQGIEVVAEELRQGLADARARRDSERADHSARRDHQLDTLEQRVAEARSSKIAPVLTIATELAVEYKAAIQEAAEKNRIEEAEAEAEFQAATVGATARRDEAEAAAEAAQSSGEAQVRSDWREGSQRFDAEARALERILHDQSASWEEVDWSGWYPDGSAGDLSIFGHCIVDIDALHPTESAHAFGLDWPGPKTYSLPAVLERPELGSMVLETDAQSRDQAIGLVTATVMRMLTSIPPGKLRLTLVDPIALGESFAGLMHLADYEEALVSSRIWTDERHIEKRLLDLTEHMERVIQKYLRNEFATIESYNEAAGEIAEPYRVLVVADFPRGFSEVSAQRLASIASSGARCGVHFIIALDPDAPMPNGVSLDDLRSVAVVIDPKGPGGSLVPKDVDHERFGFVPEQAPSAASSTGVLKRIGELATDSSLVRVPFDVIAPGPSERFSLSSAEGLSIPIGRSGASKLQRMEVGAGTLQHALVAGKTGSGKSTLFHVLVTSAALWYSPDELEVYLVDFKKGVEFKPYATHALPHARVIAIETDREYGLSVLRRVDEVLTDRGNLFRQEGAQSLADYRRISGSVMSRVLVLIDEFQELFVEDDAIAQEAMLLLDRLVRQGRAFGIHLVLGSQTLGGAYSIARTTMSQMNIRIALQCDEQDSYLILSEDNAAARLLERPGEAIYNNAGGKIEGNAVFQVTWLPRERRDAALNDVRSEATDRGFSVVPPIVFEGHSRVDPQSNRAIVGASPPPGEPVRLYLGEPIAIAPPIAIELSRRSASNVLIVGQDERATEDLLTMTIVSFAKVTVRDPGSIIYVVDGSPERSIPDDAVAVIAESGASHVRRGDVRSAETLISEVHAELERRRELSLTGTSPVLLVISGLQWFRELRARDDFAFGLGSDDSTGATSLRQRFAELIEEGPQAGIHMVVTCDTVPNFERAVERRIAREFEYRVLTQMGTMDSTGLIDSPAASKLGQHRALLYADSSATTTVFRPYGAPSPDWIASVFAMEDVDE